MALQLVGHFQHLDVEVCAIGTECPIDWLVKLGVVLILGIPFFFQAQSLIIIFLIYLDLVLGGAVGRWRCKIASGIGDGKVIAQVPVISSRVAIFAWGLSILFPLSTCSHRLRPSLRGRAAFLNDYFFDLNILVVQRWVCDRWPETVLV